MDLDIDGEIRGRTPAQVTLQANALRVMVGAGYPDATDHLYRAVTGLGAGARPSRTAPRRPVGRL